MNIKNQLVNSRSHTWDGTNEATSITVHETANPNAGAHAQAHANLQSNGNDRDASWHIQVDDTEAIRSFPDSVRCWHAGRAAQDSLSLEICVNSDGDFDQALANAAEVVKQWRADHGLGRDDVVDHHHWSGKDCPTQLRASGKWAEFVASTDPDGSNSTPSTGSGGNSSGGSSANLTEDGRCGIKTISALQRVLGVTVDGRAGEQTWTALQRMLSAPFVDGIISRQSYRATELGNGIVPRAWEFTGRGSSGSQTVQQLQRAVGASADGIWFEATTRALQRALNRGSLNR